MIWGDGIGQTWPWGYNENFVFLVHASKGRRERRAVWTRKTLGAWLCIGSPGGVFLVTNHRRLRGKREETIVAWSDQVATTPPPPPPPPSSCARGFYSFVVLASLACSLDPFTLGRVPTSVECSCFLPGSCVNCVCVYWTPAHSRVSLLRNDQMFLAWWNHASNCQLKNHHSLVELRNHLFLQSDFWTTLFCDPLVSPTQLQYLIVNERITQIISGKCFCNNWWIADRITIIKGMHTHINL